MKIDLTTNEVAYILKVLWDTRDECDGDEDYPVRPALGKLIRKFEELF